MMRRGRVAEKARCDHSRWYPAVSALRCWTTLTDCNSARQLCVENVVDSAHPKLASCHEMKHSSAVRLSSEVKGDRYVIPTTAKMCIAGVRVVPHDGRWTRLTDKEDRIGYWSVMPPEHLETSHSHHHIFPLLRFSRSADLAPGETGG